MIRRLPFLRAAVVAAGVLFGTAAQAHAGLDFTDEVSVGAASGSALFNGMNMAAFNASGTLGYVPMLAANGGGPITLADGLALPGPGFQFGTLLFRYNPTLGRPDLTQANYNTTNAYNLYIQIGAVAGTGVTLNTIEFFDPTGTASGQYSIFRAITTADANSGLHILIPPAAPPAGILPVNSLQVQTVALTFSWAEGAGNGVTISAVANPEPSTLALFGLGVLGLAAGLRRRRRKRLAAAVEAAD